MSCTGSCVVTAPPVTGAWRERMPLMLMNVRSSNWNCSTLAWRISGSRDIARMMISSMRVSSGGVCSTTREGGGGVAPSSCFSITSITVPSYGRCPAMSS